MKKTFVLISKAELIGGQIIVTNEMRVCKGMLTEEQAALEYQYFVANDATVVVVQVDEEMNFTKVDKPIVEDDSYDILFTQND